MQSYPTCIARWLLIAVPVLAQAAVPPAAVEGIKPAVPSQAALGAKMERVAPTSGHLSVAMKPDTAPKFKLLDNTGKEVSATIASDGTIHADVDPTRPYLLTPRTNERRPLVKEGNQFPGRYVTFAANGATNLGGLFLRAATVPLTWNDERRAYATELVVGYEFQDGHGDVLKAPKVVTFFAEGSNARIKEETVTITKSGGEGYQKVWLSTGEFYGETRFTARAGAADELQSSVTVQREAGALKLSLPSTEFPAFGIGSDVLTVSLLARDGAAFATPTPLEVQLTSRRLRMPSSVVVGAGKSTTEADVRSAGYGQDEIIAVSGAMRAPLPVRLVFPVAATVAALVGGALGGGARYLRNRQKRGGLVARRIVEGILVGVILVGAAWAGLVAVDLGTGVLGTPFGAFVLAALSGYLGCVVLDRVTNKTFRGLKAEE